MHRIAPTIFGSTADHSGSVSGSRPTPSSGYLQQSGGGSDRYAMKSFASNVDKDINGWKAKGKSEAWSSEDNILPVEGPNQGEIRKNMHVDVTFADAKDKKNWID